MSNVVRELRAVTGRESTQIYRFGSSPPDNKRMRGPRVGLEVVRTTTHSSVADRLESGNQSPR